MKISQLFESEPMVIRLKGFKAREEDTPARDFMREFEQITQEHPFTRGMRYFEDGPVLISIRSSNDHPDEVDLGDIQSKARGAGARALTTICGIADKHDVSIDLHAYGYDDVPTEKLVSYYERFGFECRDEFATRGSGKGDSEGQDMVRRPHS